MSSKHAFQGSSPSSGGAESVAGSPETRLTPFSSVKSVHEKTGFLFNQLPSSPADFQESSIKVGFETADKDPFISTSIRTKYEQSLLSPTASTFQPFALRISQKLHHTPMIAKSPGPRAAITNEYTTESPVNVQGSPVNQSGTFSTDLGFYTRALKVSGDRHPVQLAAVENCVQETYKEKKCDLSFIRSGSDILVRFSDIIDAINAYNHIKMDHPEWSIEFIAPAVFAQKTNSTLPYVSAHEGQVGLVANFPSSGFDRSKLEGIILDLLSVDGTVYAYQKQLATEAGTFRLIAEYGDVNAAARAIERLNGATVRGINISIAFHKPDINTSPRSRGYPSTPTRGGMNPRDPSSLARMPMVNTAMDVSMTPDVFASVLSPTGRSFVPTTYTISPQYSAVPVLFGGQFSPVNNTIGGCTPTINHCPQDYAIYPFGASGPIHPGLISQAGNWGGFNSHTQVPSRDGPLLRFSTRRQSGSRGSNRSTYPNSQVGQHNVVDMDRIRAGLDVRTTIMLRNIPNKIDQGQLKAIIDQTSRGLYDFMYLRIDFANNCNVGYAFINFEDPYHIINFVAARAGQRWNRYGSDKIAEVSYATIQGKDCLVQKFRNSSVMLEHPSYRPKIFYTGSHPRAGEEEEFPLPDNASKMRRSVENAEHVGLFAPRAGQHYRDEQRRRRSRYDRGTPLAALEEYDYEELYPSEQDLQAQYTCERPLHTALRIPLTLKGDERTFSP